MTSDGARDFDFLHGRWRIDHRLLKERLAGCEEWEEFSTALECRPILGGAGNLDEGEFPDRGYHAMSLRLYNPDSRQWSLNFANSSSGTVGPPTIGEFKNGRGEFYDQETLNGRSILVRFIISDITATSCRFEQAFSDDGGKTWEVNWIATDTRTKSADEKAR